MRFAPGLSIAFFLGVILLVASQYAPSFDMASVLSLAGGALLIVVAIRGLQ